MRGQQCELAVGVDLHAHLGKPASDAEAPPAQLKTVVGVRTARGKGEPAQNGHMDVRIADNSLKISPPVIRALLHLPKFEHDNRSFEALLDMSHLVGENKFTPFLLPGFKPPSQRGAI